MKLFEAPKVLLVNVFVIALGLFVFEQVSPLLGYVNVPKSPKRAIRLSELKPNLDEYRRPDYQYMRAVDTLEKKNYKLRTDKDGYILPTNARSSTDLKILFLGGSTTECLYVDEDKRFPYLVARMLSTSTSNVASLNGGVSGNNTIDATNLLINKGLASRPKIVVLMENINDLGVLLKTRGNYWSDNKLMVDRLLVYEVKPKLYDFLQQIFPVTSYGLRIGGSIMSQAWSSVAPGDSGAQRARAARHLPTANRLTGREKMLIRNEFKNSLKRFVSIVKASGSTPVLMTQMNRLESSPPDFQKADLNNALVLYGTSYREYRALYNDFNAIIRSVARENRIPLIDLASEIPQSNKYIYDVVHLNVAGSVKASEIVARALRPLLRTSLK